MSTRRAKQIIYGTLYVILWVLFFGAIYMVLIRPFLNTAPTAPACTTNCIPVGAGEIATSSVNSFVTAPDHYTFLAQIANGASQYAAQGFTYEIDLYNGSGTLIQAIPGGQSFLFERQTKYLVIPNQVITTPFSKASLSLSNVSWIDGATLGGAPRFPTGDFPVGNLQFANGSDTVSVSGQISNPGIGTYPKVYVIAIFDDQNGNPIGASDTEIDGVGPGSTANFNVMYPALPGINASESHIFVYGLPQ